MEGKLTELVSRLKEAAGKNLESVVLYGSAARSDFHPGISDLNVCARWSQLICWNSSCSPQWFAGGRTR